MLRRLEISCDWDTLYWPYYMYRKIEPEQAARYFGHKWFLLVHVLFWEIIISERATDD